ncbi:pro-cathepsin H [Planoprotostelium fungivorum]|uniref:Pro-cathepsin H n=1 Tax=Planoprotostelium fungivorum TaxID=1890364 RepID=A0A2P6NXY4_9EUKA|nr:pro-cathepsin H [Planoprotostelium fungivorum]
MEGKEEEECQKEEEPEHAAAVTEEPSPPIDRRTSRSSRSPVMLSKREMVINELIHTEETYAHDLSIVVNIFLAPLKSKEIFEEGTIKTIFSNIETILTISIELIAVLQSEPAQEIQVGAIFKSSVRETDVAVTWSEIKRQSEAFRCYSTFLREQGGSTERVGQLRAKNQKLDEIIKESEAHESCRGQRLEEFLILPMQRLTRYPLLLKKLLDNTETTHPDYESLELAVKYVSQLCNTTNDEISKSVNLSKTSLVINQFYYAEDKETLQALYPSRFIKEGSCTITMAKKVFPGYLFLFEDWLVVVQKDTTFKLTKLIQIPNKHPEEFIGTDRLFVRDQPGADDLNLDLTNESHVIARVTFQSMQEKRSWRYALYRVTELKVRSVSQRPNSMLVPGNMIFITKPRRTYSSKTLIPQISAAIKDIHGAYRKSGVPKAIGTLVDLPSTITRYSSPQLTTEHIQAYNRKYQVEPPPDAGGTMNLAVTSHVTPPPASTPTPAPAPVPSPASLSPRSPPRRVESSPKMTHKRENSTSSTSVQDLKNKLIEERRRRKQAEQTIQEMKTKEGELMRTIAELKKKEVRGICPSAPLVGCDKCSELSDSKLLRNFDGDSSKSDELKTGFRLLFLLRFPCGDEMNKFFFLLAITLAAALAQDSSSSTSVSVDPTIPDEEPWWRKPMEDIEDHVKPSDATKTKFLTWIKKHAKKFHASELETRFQLWKKQVKKVFDINNGNLTWRAELNGFSAHTKEELKNLLGAFSLPPVTNDTKPATPSKRFRPSWVDWTQRGAVTSVKNQGGCGSCWAFSSSASLEGGRAIAGHGLMDLSPQHIMNCGNLGACNGGDPLGAIRWGSHNIGSWGDVPYVGSQQGCWGVNRQVNCNGYVESRSGSDEDAANVIAGGPTSICFNVVDQFFSYRDGVFAQYCPHGCNHAVLAVGYAENCQNSGRNCYIIKNSWGSGWGKGGYFLIERSQNMCGIADYLGRPDRC